MPLAMILDESFGHGAVATKQKHVSVVFLGQFHRNAPKMW